MMTATETICPPWCRRHEAALGEPGLVWHRSAAEHTQADDAEGLTVWTEQADQDGATEAADVVVQVDGTPYSALLTPAQARRLAAQLVRAADQADR